jgi:hypothetical protein
VRRAVGNVAGPPTTQPQAPITHHPGAGYFGRASVLRPGELVLRPWSDAALHASGWLVVEQGSVGATHHRASCSGWAPSQKCPGHHLLVRAHRLRLEQAPDALCVEWQTTTQTRTRPYKTFRWIRSSRSTFPPSATRAIPHTGRGIGIPASHRLFSPVDDVLSILGVLPSQSARDTDALHRFRPVQPGAADGCGERHHAMLEEPLHQITGQVPCQGIQHQHDASWWQGQVAGRMTQPRFPLRIQRALRFGGKALGRLFLLHLGEHVGQFPFQPGMHHRIGR